ncbi:MAG: ribonuclease III [Rickettsiales bacterium]|nr:ribonuclease III [Rickettsiales bacterium]|tara:strand:+ start:2555 stop:3277 length:723 start_codon:yes stop_codon:yes gene_type:complete
MAAERPALDELEFVVGHVFADRALLERALTHRSWVSDGDGRNRGEDNERLEFLGDAVLDLVISEQLYRASDSAEGRLTRARAMLVRRESLARHARALGLGGFLLLGRGEERSGGADKDSILADALESLIAALYLDAGFTVARDFVTRLFAQDLARRGQDGELHAPRDSRTELQEVLQGAGRGTPEYRLKDSSGPDHMPVWVMEVVVAGQVLAVGQGSTKQGAARAAALSALQKLSGSGDG